MHLGEWQRKANVHFLPKGSRMIARQVAAQIRKALPEGPATAVGPRHRAGPVARASQPARRAERRHEPTTATPLIVAREATAFPV